MRIIAGRFKGRRLAAIKGDIVRPTSDRVKESIFSILGVRVITADFLDRCAGTGNMGLEALSRGANSATFMDRDFLRPVERRAGEDVFCVSAGAALYRRPMLDALRLRSGTFDGAFFMYFEDVDLGWRARLDPPRKHEVTLARPPAVC